ncbi:winged helix-turn-helix domain-containing protein [Polaribacter sp. Hel1_85]|uniref:winged helix-turn-helix domain-containing protein n=1 Tax=Polaribacter sp. Hel1_85 TaxID=1250005 RepID=UPI00052C3D21|nr:winged helix-turn-helix domain-containing protein [Polaribacter sp. Hel1_85]KGL62586.1 two-component system response regulator [Polaribacter sp. Hel1_85]
MSKKNIFRVLLLAIAVFGFLNFSSPKNENEDFSEKVKVALREVGNQLLLSQKDSSSLVLPVKEIDENKFSLSFEKKLSFEPNTLVIIIRNVFQKTSLSKKYRVAVIRCSDNEVAYSYEIHELEEQTIIPCAGRYLPENCYSVRVNFLKETNQTSIIKIIFYTLFLIAILWLMYFVFTKKKPLQKIKPKNKNSINIGSFQFYPEQNKLVKKAAEIPLSKKECELLEIFVANPNQVIKREELTKKVWEDNGVFVGRSLDTYISKLRKKLQEDKNIKLTNIHGVGYKLEVK